MYLMNTLKSSGGKRRARATASRELQGLELVDRNAQVARRGSNAERRETLMNSVANPPSAFDRWGACRIGSMSAR